MKFIDKCIAGEERPCNIYFYMEDWHESPEEIRAYDFLGLTREEYGEWVKDHNAIYKIIESRKAGVLK